MGLSFVKLPGISRAIVVDQMTLSLTLVILEIAAIAGTIDKLFSTLSVFLSR